MSNRLYFRMRTWPLLLLTPALSAQRGAIPMDQSSIESGKQIYLGSCSGCHGATGEGSQGPSLLSGRASRLPDQTLLNSIRNGLPGTSMPNFPMSDDQIKQVASFVRSLTQPAINTQQAGDTERGRALFFGAGKCSNCHMIAGQGGHPGPDLSNIALERTVHQLTESLRKPSERIANGFRSATVVLKSGRSIQGITKNSNNYSLQILDKSGRLHLLTRDEIAELDISNTSMMPPVTDPAELRDLIAFLSRQSTRTKEGESQ